MLRSGCKLDEKEKHEISICKTKSTLNPSWVINYTFSLAPVEALKIRSELCSYMILITVSFRSWFLLPSFWNNLTAHLHKHERDAFHSNFRHEPLTSTPSPTNVPLFHSKTICNRDVMFHKPILRIIRYESWEFIARPLNGLISRTAKFLALAKSELFFHEEILIEFLIYWASFIATADKMIESGQTINLKIRSFFSPESFVIIRQELEQNAELWSRKACKSALLLVITFANKSSSDLEDENEERKQIGIQITFWELFLLVAFRTVKVTVRDTRVRRSRSCSHSRRQVSIELANKTLKSLVKNFLSLQFFLFIEVFVFDSSTWQKVY